MMLRLELFVNVEQGVEKMLKIILQQILTSIHQGEIDKAREHFSVMILPKLSLLDQNDLSEALNPCHQLAFHLPLNISHLLYGEIGAIFRSRIGQEFNSIHSDFFRKAAEVFADRNEWEFAILYLTKARCLIGESPEHNLSGLDERLTHAAMQQLHTLLLDYWSDIFQISPSTNLVDLTKKWQKRIDFLVCYWLQKKNSVQVDALYKLLEKNLFENLISWLDAELSKARFDSLEKFESVITIIRPIIETLLKHQRWELARRCNVLILKYATNSAQGFKREKIEAELTQIIGYQQQTQNLPTVIINNERFWRPWREKIKKARKDLADGLTPQADIFEIQEVFTLKIRELIKEISEYIVAQIDEEQILGWQLLGLGSIAEGSMAPYSDLDCAILVAEEKQRNDPYFVCFIKILQTMVQLVGEPNGFWLDEGDVLHLTQDEKAHLNTAEGFKKCYPMGSLTQPETNSLRFPVTLYTHTAGQNLLTSILQDNDLQLSLLNQETINKLIEYYAIECKYSELTNLDVNDLKETYLRPMQLWAQAILLLFGCHASDQKQTLNLLQKHLHPHFYKLWRSTLSIVQTRRVQLHLGHRKQHDELASATEMSNQLDLIMVCYKACLIQERREANVYHPGLTVLKEFCDNRHSIRLKLIYTLITSFHHSVTNVEMQQDVYLLLSKYSHTENLRHLMYLQLPPENLALKHRLAAQPNPYGIRLSESISDRNLHQQLMQMTADGTQEGSNAALVGNLVWWNEGVKFKRSLPSSVLPKIWDEQNQRFHSSFQNSRHAVVRLYSQSYDCYVKILPDQPLMDKAIYLLHSRIIGHGVVSSRLARLELKSKDGKTKFYPVLFSPTVAGETLRTVLKNSGPKFEVDHDYYTQLVLLAPLINGGDSASRNIIVTKNAEKKTTLVSVDNEQFFVEPLVKQSAKDKQNTVQFHNILFCLEQANQPLSTSALQRFTDIPHVFGFLQMWVSGVTNYGDEYLTLFNETERKLLFQNDEEKRFTPLLLLREGVLGGMYIQFNALQNHIRLCLNTKKQLTALDLLDFINPRLGHYYRNAYQRSDNPEQRFQLATGSPQESLSSSLALKASLGVIPSFEQIEHDPRYALSSAKKELIALLDFKPDFSKLLTNEGQPDKNRQLMMVKALALYPHDELTLAHCAVLTDELLIETLVKSEGKLRRLDLRGCPLVTSKSISYLADKQANLIELYLSDCASLERMSNKFLFSTTALAFPNLTKLNVSRCVQLRQILINAPLLRQEELKAISCSPALSVMNTGWIKVPLTTSSTSAEPSSPEISRFKSYKKLGDGETYEVKIFVRGFIYEKIDAIESYMKKKLVNDAAQLTGNFNTIFYQFDKWKFKLIVWTGSGLERAGEMDITKYPGTALFLLFVNRTSIEKFNEGLSQYNEIEEYFPTTPFIVVGIDTYEDEKGRLSSDECVSLARRRGAKLYVECSAKDQVSLETLFKKSCEVIINHYGIPNEKNVGNNIPAISGYELLEMRNIKRKVGLNIDVALLGGSRAGVSSLCNKHIGKEFVSESEIASTTQNASFSSYPQIFDYKINFHAHDKSGQNQVSINSNKKYQLIIWVFSIENSAEDLERDINRRIEDVKKSFPKAAYLLVGNKIDLEEQRQLTYDQALKVKEKFGMIDYLECSAKTGEGVKEVFEYAEHLGLQQYLAQHNIKVDFSDKFTDLRQFILQRNNASASATSSLTM
jgi:GTPase SAR1 family protein